MAGVGVSLRELLCLDASCIWFSNRAATSDVCERLVPESLPFHETCSHPTIKNVGVGASVATGTYAG